MKTKALAIISTVVITITGLSQTSVLYNSDLYEVGTVFTNRTIEDALFDPGSAGLGSWNFSAYTDGDTSSFISIAYDPTIPHIGDCDVPPNYILYYSGSTDTSETEGWGFFNVEPAFVDGLGLYGTLETGGSTYRLGSFNNTYTHAYSFPINYGNSWVEASSGGGFIYAFGFTINFSVQETSWYNADGYGSITLPTGTYNALRVKKRNWRHSWSSHWMFGFDKVERRVSYIWFSTELGNSATFAGPIDSTGGQPDSTFTSGNLTFQIQNNSLEVSDNISLPRSEIISAYPNPFNSAVTIAIAGVGAYCNTPLQSAEIEIFDLNGRRVAHTPFGSAQGTEIRSSSEIETTAEGQFIWHPDESLPSGVYLVRAQVGKNTAVRRLVYLK